MHAGLGGPDEQDRLFALSELSFAFAEKHRDAGYYFASAIYAYSFLFPADRGTAPGQYDARVPLAIDLYNQGIAAGHAKANAGELELDTREVKLPSGLLMLQRNDGGFHYGGYSLGHFVSLSQFQVRGPKRSCVGF